MLLTASRFVLVGLGAWAAVLVGAVHSPVWASNAEVEISGKLAKWHKVSLTFDGPETSERATPNPFTDYRLDVAVRRTERSEVRRAGLLRCRRQCGDHGRRFGQQVAGSLLGR